MDTWTYRDTEASPSTFQISRCMSWRVHLALGLNAKERGIESFVGSLQVYYLTIICITLINPNLKPHRPLHRNAWYRRSERYPMGRCGIFGVAQLRYHWFVFFFISILFLRLITLRWQKSKIRMMEVEMREWWLYWIHGCLSRRLAMIRRIQGKHPVNNLFLSSILPLNSSFQEFSKSHG